MSYILTASGSSLATPVSVANGGTGADNTKDALITLTSPAFEVSATEPNWGAIPVMTPPSKAEADLFASLQELLAALQQLAIIQVI
jgi:hypothetical protein